jgi:hypothetical protein
VNRNQATQMGSLSFTDPNGDVESAGFGALMIVPAVAANVANCAEIWRGDFLNQRGITSGRITLGVTFNHRTELRGNIPLDVILFDREGNPSNIVRTTVTNWATGCDIPGGVPPSSSPPVLDILDPSFSVPFGARPRRIDRR